VPIAVVELPVSGFGEDLVGLGGLPEALLRLGMVGDVGVELARQAPEADLISFSDAPGSSPRIVVVIALRVATS
jgi:hypothetical protein